MESCVVRYRATSPAVVLVVLAACTPSPGEVTPTDTEATDATSTDEPSGDASPATTGDVVDDTVRRRG